MAARCFLLICFTGQMTNFSILTPSEYEASNRGTYLFYHGAAAVDGITGATPLAAVKTGESVQLFDLFWGFTGGLQ